MLDGGGGGHGISVWPESSWEARVLFKVEGNNDVRGSRADQSNELFESTLQAEDENKWVEGRSGRRLKGLSKQRGRGHHTCHWSINVEMLIFHMDTGQRAERCKAWPGLCK